MANRSGKYRNNKSRAQTSHYPRQTNNYDMILDVFIYFAFVGNVAKKIVYFYITSLIMRKTYLFYNYNYNI